MPRVSLSLIKNYPNTHIELGSDDRTKVGPWVWLVHFRCAVQKYVHLGIGCLNLLTFGNKSPLKHWTEALNVYTLNSEIQLILYLTRETCFGISRAFRCVKVKAQ